MPKKQLIRVVRTPEGEIMIDLTGKKSGRGAYLCGKAECFKLAQKSRALDRALSHQVAPDIYEQLAKDFIHVEDQFIAARSESADE